LKETFARNSIFIKTQVEKRQSLNFPRNRRFIVTDVCASCTLIIKLIHTGKQRGYQGTPLPTNMLTYQVMLTSLTDVRYWKYLLNLLSEEVYVPVLWTS